MRQRRSRLLGVWAYVGCALSLGLTSAQAVVPGDGKGKAENDCRIVLNGYDAADLTPLEPGSAKTAIQCTDGNPACDLDGVPYPDGRCTFRVGVCVNQPHIEGCAPGSLGKISATAKAHGGKAILLLDDAAPLPLDGSSACGALVDFVVPVKVTRNGDRPGEGSARLVATRPSDRDRIDFRCLPGCSASSGALCDLGDGTIVDSATGLQWEKKDGVETHFRPGNGRPYGDQPHDVDDTYAFAGTCLGSALTYCQATPEAAAACRAQIPDDLEGDAGCNECPGGSTCQVEGRNFLNNLHRAETIWDWLARLNALQFAGHDDWRLPTIGTSPEQDGELESIVDLQARRCGDGRACIDPVFGPTAPGAYWAPAFLGGPMNAYLTLDFATGEPTPSLLVGGFAYARAVRNR
jgi:hypothetical protein